MLNNSRTWSVLFVISTLLLCGGYFLGGRQGLLFGFLFSLSINSLAYYYADSRYMKKYADFELEGQDPWGLLDIARDICKINRLPSVRVFIIPLATPTAFAVGKSRNSGAVFVSQALVDNFSSEEIKAVMAFHISQIHRQDTLSNSVAAIVSGLLLVPAESLDRLLTLTFAWQKRIKRQRIGLTKTLCAPIAAAVIKLFVPRKNCYDSDRLAAKWIQNNDLMARVLWKLHFFSRTLPSQFQENMVHMFTVNPLTLRGLNRYFQVQPSVEHRILKLVGRYPI